MKNVIIYARVSTKDQSTELQHRELQNYIQTRGWLLIKSIEDMMDKGFKQITRYDEMTKKLMSKVSVFMTFINQSKQKSLEKCLFYLFLA